MNRIVEWKGEELGPRAHVTDDRLPDVLDRWQRFLTPDGGKRGIMIL